MKPILAVDIGTTSAKALLVSPGGEVLTRVQEFYPTRSPRGDFSEQDPLEILHAVKKIINHAAVPVGGLVAGVSFSSAMHSLVAVNEEGEALTPLITWADLRSSQEAAGLRNAAGQKIYEETGTPIHPMSPLCKLIWLKHNQPELFDSRVKFIGIKEYIWFNLFRTFVVDQSIASATGLFNAATRTWSSAALAAAGITAHQLSVPCSVYSVYKDPGAHLASEFGLSRSIPWVIGASDGCLANLGSGAMDEETLSLTVGTSGAVRKVTHNITPDCQGRTFHYLLDEDKFITGGATNNGAVLVQWFSEKILKQHVNIKSFGERAVTIPPGAGGLLFLPYMLGERAPVFDPESSGAFVGVRKHHTTEHFMRAVLEGIGYALFSIATILEENSGPSQKVIASGGFIQSHPWVQIMADIFGKEMLIRGSDDASSLGAAMMGFRALGIEANFQLTSEKIFHPDPTCQSLYQKYFAVYQQLYSSLRDSFHSLNLIT